MISPTTCSLRSLRRRSTGPEVRTPLKMLRAAGEIDYWDRPLCADASGVL
jgi:hypothetical protein